MNFRRTIPQLPMNSEFEYYLNGILFGSAGSIISTA
jgi:hypothetical protein